MTSFLVKYHLMWVSQLVFLVLNANCFIVIVLLLLVRFYILRFLHNLMTACVQIMFLVILKSNCITLKDVSHSIFYCRPLPFDKFIAGHHEKNSS